MSPSLPTTDESLPSLADAVKSATTFDDEKMKLLPGESLSATSVSSDLSTTSHAADAASNYDRRYYYLSPNAVKRLPQYQYHGEDHSLLYKYVLSPLAAWCVDNLTPTWLAPNAITSFGLLLMCSAYCLIWYFCPGMYEANTDIQSSSAIYAVPGIIFLWNCSAMLIYQTLDNMDGKQARKTGSGSPLGLLFDHGCDAANSIFGSANWIAAMAMIPGNVSDLLGSDDHGNIQSKSLVSEFFGGDAVLAALLILCPMIAFYISTWEQYYTGKLILPPFNGPSEGLVLGASLSLISFICGPMFWQKTSLVDGVIEDYTKILHLETFSWMEGRVRNMDLIVVASVVGLVQEVLIKMFQVVRTYGLSTLRTVLPNLILAGATLAMVHLDPTIFLRRPRTMMHLISGLFTEMTTQLMLDHMVEEGYELRKRWCLFPQIFLVSWMMSGSYSVEAFDTVLLVYSTGLWIYLAFRIRIQIHEICDVLGIWCFDIVTPHPKKLMEVKGENVETDGVAKPTVNGSPKKTK